MLTFEASKLEYQLAARIARRAVEDYENCFDYAKLEMDIIACHLNGCPLDLLKLSEASPRDFAHDVAGITKHLDRNTGNLAACFLPRCHAQLEPQTRRCRDCNGRGFHGGDGHSDDTNTCGSCGGCGMVPA